MACYKFLNRYTLLVSFRRVVYRIQLMNTNLTPIAAAFAPSPQQAVFFDWITNGTGSCILEAVAGSGKTTTLIHGLGLMYGRVFFGAYSKNIAEEISGRVGKRDGLFVSTMHAAGFGAVRNAWKHIRVDSNKCRSIFRDASDRFPEYSKFEGTVLKLVGYAKQAAIGVGDVSIADRSAWFSLIDHFSIETFDEDTCTDNTELIIKLAIKTLKASNDTCHISVDFDDMVYAPLFHNLRLFEYDWVLIDEAQDTNRSRRLLALRMLKRGGRMVAVGDSCQAIFGFTGADADSLDRIAESVNAIRLPLTITYRCPKAVVAYAQNWVSHIHAADTAPEGVLSHIDLEALVTSAIPGDVVLCRFTKPLIENVYSFIAAGIPAKVEGRQIGEGLIALASRWKVKSFTTLTDRLNTYVERETAKWRAKENEAKAAGIEDQVKCLFVVIDRAKAKSPNTKNPVAVITEEIAAIFEDNVSGKVVTFSTIHKAKGREWHRVFWLQTGKAAWARKAWEEKQEEHINYVGATRAKHELTLVAA